MLIEMRVPIYLQSKPNPCLNTKVGKETIFSQCQQKHLMPPFVVLMDSVVIFLITHTSLGNWLPYFFQAAGPLALCHHLSVSLLLSAIEKNSFSTTLI